MTAAGARPFPISKTAILVGLGTTVGYFVLIAALPSFWVFIINQCVIAAIGALGLNLLTGYAGLVSVGNAAFLAIGGYVTVAVASSLGFFGAIILGTFACGLVGFVVGLPALRLRGIYLAISTLALQYIVVFFFQKIQDGAGAVSGYSVDYPGMGAFVVDTDVRWSIVLFIALIISVYICACLVHSRPGRAWAAIREHDIAAALAGIDVRRYKLMAFVISSMMIGASGVLRTYYIGHIGYEEFTLDLTVAYVAMIIVGGMASIPGSILGAALVTGLPYVVQSIATNAFSESSSGFIIHNLSLINITLYGIIVMFFLMFEPRGLASLIARAWKYTTGKKPPRTQSPVRAREVA